MREGARQLDLKVPKTNTVSRQKETRHGYTHFKLISTTCTQLLDNRIRVPGETHCVVVEGKKINVSLTMVVGSSPVSATQNSLIELDLQRYLVV